MGGVSLFRVKTGCVFMLEATPVYTCTAGSPYSCSASLNVVEISSSNKPTKVKPVYTNRLATIKRLAIAVCVAWNQWEPSLENWLAIQLTQGQIILEHSSRSLSSSIKVNCNFQGIKCSYSMPYNRLWHLKTTKNRKSV